MLIPETNSRQNVKRSADQVVNGMCLGVVNARAKGIVYSLAARLRPNLTRTLVNFARKNCPSFKFTSIQVNKNYLSALHVDKNNHGDSYIIGVGDYADGELWVQNEGAVNCRHRWQRFNGNFPHCTLPYAGTRYTLIFFTQQSYKLLGRGLSTAHLRQQQLARGAREPAEPPLLHARDEEAMPTMGTAPASSGTVLQATGRVV